MPSLIQLNNFFKSRFYKFLVALVVAINGYLLFALGSDEQKAALKTNLGKFGAFIVDWSGTVIFLSILLGGVFSILIGWIQEKINENKLSESYSVILLETIESVVEEKRKRFAAAVESLLKKNTNTMPTAGTVFKNITQPEEQIKNIIKALEVCYKSLYPDVYFKIALMEVENNSLKKWAFFLPYTARPNTNILDLRSSESAISHALTSKSLVVIADVQKELKKSINKKYVKGSTKLNEEWSQLCYPIKSITTNEVIFIICIAAKKANFFKIRQNLWILMNGS